MKEGKKSTIIWGKNGTLLKTYEQKVVDGEYAERMLSSSRSELQRCLFDLRGHALEERNLGDAIRSTLEPLLGAVGLQLEFDVPRRTVSESTAHALLCIVRELVSNASDAIDRAKFLSLTDKSLIADNPEWKIQIAANRDAKTLMISDDGTGMDADELFDRYREKNRENFDRQYGKSRKPGYEAAALNGESR